MNQALVTVILSALILLFILSPFAALASLMLVLVVATMWLSIGTIVQTLIRPSDRTTHSPSKSDS